MRRPLLALCFAVAACSSATGPSPSPYAGTYTMTAWNLGATLPAPFGFTGCVCTADVQVSDYIVGGSLTLRGDGTYMEVWRDSAVVSHRTGTSQLTGSFSVAGNVLTFIEPSAPTASRTAIVTGAVIHFSDGTEYTKQ